MPARILDGKKLAAQLLAQAKSEVTALKEKGIVPKLVVVQAGQDGASTIYVEKKHRACIDAGMASEIKRFAEYVSEEIFLAEIRRLNQDSKVHGILVQLPLPKHISEEKVLEAVDPSKDVDGFHPTNQGKGFFGAGALRPATPAGIMRLLEETGVKLEGKNAVVLGRSNIVGKPVALMLINAGCTVTVCNSKTKNIADFTKMADIIISATGKPGLIAARMVKKGAIVVDVGINRIEEPTGGNGKEAGAKGNAKKIVGDVDFEGVRKKAGWITPVPGGVGPMTIANVILNTLKACKRQQGPS